MGTSFLTLAVALMVIGFVVGVTLLAAEVINIIERYVKEKRYRK